MLSSSSFCIIKRLLMAFNHFINMIFLLVVNVLFFLTGICLNSLVVLSFWRYAHLRKKKCHFMILILSCCDLLAILTNHPLMAVMAMLWLTGKLNEFPNWVDISMKQTNLFLGFSLLVLVVMSLDRYLAVFYPIFHRTSVSKRRLLTVLGMLIFMEITLQVLCVTHVLSYQKGLLIFIIIVITPSLFIHWKLFIIARKNRRHNAISTEMQKTHSLKNISSCLLAIACFVALSIPALVYIWLKTFILDNADVVGIWSKTIASMNSTFNCLIFYWKDKTLRNEGMKIIKSPQVRRAEVLDATKTSNALN